MVIRTRVASSGTNGYMSLSSQPVETVTAVSTKSKDDPQPAPRAKEAEKKRGARLTDAAPAPGILALRVVADLERAPDQLGRIVDRRALDERQRRAVDKQCRGRVRRRRKQAAGAAERRSVGERGQPR